LPATGPGEGARLQARVVAPDVEGPHRLVFEPVREGITWFGAGDAPPVDVEVGPGPLRWSLVEVPSLPRLAARSVVTVPVKIRNEGTEAWTSKAGDRITYRWRDGEDATAGEGIRTALPETVAPGEQIEVQLRVAAPAEPGDHRLEIRPVREHVRWFGPPVRGPAALDVTVEAPALAWTVLDVDPPAWVWVGRTAVARVTVRNDGSSTWSPSTADRFSYRWIDALGEIVVPEGRRFELPHDVEPGQSITMTLEIIGTPQSGEHVLQLRMVREHVAWFGPPTNPEAASMSVPVVWQSTLLGLLLGAAVLAVVVLRRLPRTKKWSRRLDPWVWPVWTMACVWLVSEAFSDLSGVQFFEAGRFVAVSCGALAGATVAAIGRAPRVVALVGTAVLAVLVIADLAYIDFFGSLVPLAAVAALDHLSDAGGSVVSLLRPSYGWVLLLPGTGVVLAIGLGRLRRGSSWQRWSPAVLLLAVGMPAILVIGSTLAGKSGNRVFSEYRNAGRLSVVGAHLFQVARAVAALGGPSNLSDTERDEVESFYATRARERADAEPVPKPEPPLNVVLIQVEALQHWAMDAEVDGQPIMPFLRSQSEQALVFDRVFDQTAQGRTSDAEYLVLASNHALAEGALSFLRADAHFLTIAHVLKDAGYTTLSAHPYRRGFWNRAALHPRYGFESSLFQRELGSGVQVGWGLADQPFLDRMAEHLAVTEQPFFAFLITLSLHHPYDDFPTALREIDLGELEGTDVGNYLHAMRHFDTSLAAFFQHLRDAELAQRTMVVIYGDHVTGMKVTPAIVELAGLPSRTPSTAMLLHRVPVIIWRPGEPRLAGRRDRIGGQIDIAPTILHLLDVPTPDSFVGLPLTEPVNWAALPDGSAVTDDRVFIADGEDIPAGGACFDHPRGSLRPRDDCREIEARASEELAASRALLNHDLFDELGRGM
jgi:phosphoglycerol transferase MdoB-like AlkP superfamily enzyme